MPFMRGLFYASSSFFEIAKGVIFFVVFAVLIHLFVATIFIVDGISMASNFHTGELIIVNRWSYLFGEPQRGDVVVMRFPGDPDRRKYVKRLIGLPRERVDIHNGRVFINGSPLEEPYLDPGMITTEFIEGKTSWTLDEDEYFLIGDNRPHSNDSRTWDSSQKRFFIGKAVFILWPFDDAGVVPKQNYPELSRG